MKRYSLFIPPLLFSLVFANIPYENTPSWYSFDINNYSTGAAWADINQDGLLDLVIANGNDMQRQHLVVYFNTPEGLSHEIGWQSDDIDYHGHIAVGDINKNGYPDIVASVYLGEEGFGSQGRVKLYLNNNGTLSSTPDWVSSDTMYTFSCALGDATGNGYLDLAVATGEMYWNTADYNRIYYNQDGIFSDYPDWFGDTPDISTAVGWGDFDSNGLLDVVFASAGSPNRIYFNQEGSISTTPGWSSADTDQFANSLSIGDINNNGWLDLAVSDNSQLGGSGNFKIYLNEAGTMTSLPWWTSQFSGYGSGIALTDVTGNGYKDLITGGWWQPLRIYVNDQGIFESEPAWTASFSSVVEKIVIADSRNLGLIEESVEFIGDGNRKVFYLPVSPIQDLILITVNDTILESENYCFNLELGWISLSSAPQVDSIIEIQYVYSNTLDIAVSNWGSTEPNILYLNNADTQTFSYTLTDGISLTVYPNPIRKNDFPEVTITLKNTNRELTAPLISIYNIKGQRVRDLTPSSYASGMAKYTWDGKNETNRTVSRGVYLIKVDTQQALVTRKIIIY